MKATDLINSLAATTSRTEKEALLASAFSSGHRDFFIAAKLALDTLVTFGVQKVPRIEEDDGSPGRFTFEQFLELADNLRRRNLTGHAARDAIIDAANISHADDWNIFYRAVLLKDFRAGIEEKTINKVLSGLAKKHPEAAKYLIPVFACQLAHDGADEKHLKKMRGTKMLDVKLDGVRLLTILDKESGVVEQRTRNGKLNTNFPHLTEALGRLIDDLPGSVVLDGEVVSTSFWELMTQVNRRDDIDSRDAKLALFDIIPLADFKSGVCKKSQRERHDVLSALSGMFQRVTNDGSIFIVPKRTINLDTEEGQSQFASMNREALEAGYEGIMVKDPDAPYECKRSSAWLKVKPVIVVSLTVVGIEPGTGKYEGMIGALICEGEDEGRIIKTNVGSGLTDADRAGDPQAWIGQVVDIKADCFSKERDSDTWSLRFPRFERFRSITRTPGEKD